MFKQIHCLIGCIGLVAAISLSLLPGATAQTSQQETQIRQSTLGHSTPVAQTTRTTQTNFEGRGVAQGSAFTRGRNANAILTFDGDNFGLELLEPRGDRARVQYRGSVIRQTNDSSNSSSFTLDGRVQSFTSSGNLRVRNNTIGTCRIEVFDARVVSSNCNSVASDSSIRFLGLEQF